MAGKRSRKTTAPVSPAAVHWDSTGHWPANIQAVQVLSECSAQSVRTTCVSQLRGTASTVSTSSKAKLPASRYSDQMKITIQRKISNEMLRKGFQFFFSFK